MFEISHDHSFFRNGTKNLLNLLNKSNIRVQDTSKRTLLFYNYYYTLLIQNFILLEGSI